MPKAPIWWVVGGGNVVASDRYDKAADTVASKLEAIHEQIEGSPEPTEAELANLRNRYLEHQAISKRLGDLLRRENPDVTLWVTIFTTLYRVVLLAAAITILCNNWKQT
jgi:hypothetical protein